MKKYEIHVKYTTGDDKYLQYHTTNWGSASIERAIKNVHSIMNVINNDGKFRFAGAQVIEEGKTVVYKLER